MRTLWNVGSNKCCPATRELREELLPLRSRSSWETVMFWSLSKPESFIVWNHTGSFSCKAWVLQQKETPAHICLSARKRSLELEWDPHSIAKKDVALCIITPLTLVPQLWIQVNKRGLKNKSVVHAKYKFGIGFNWGFLTMLVSQ